MTLRSTVRFSDAISARALGLGVCLAIASAFCVLPESRAAFEPWASNTDPSDIPGRQVQDITNAPFIYNITLGGTMDGRMCCTLPGVWEPYEQTWESSRSIRMENVGDTKVLNPWLKLGPIDFFSQQTIANSVVGGWQRNGKKPSRCSTFTPLIATTRETETTPRRATFRKP